ncbi:hypothetical protein D3C72_2102970 [compost metagenome]
MLARQRLDQLRLHGVVPFRQLQQRVSHCGLFGMAQGTPLHVGHAHHARAGCVQRHRAACHGHFAKVETRAGTAAARPHHGHTGLGRPQHLVLGHAIQATECPFQGGRVRQGQHAHPGGAPGVGRLLPRL